MQGLAVNERLVHALTVFSDDEISLIVRRAQPLSTYYPGDDYDYIFEFGGVHWKIKADQPPYKKGGYRCGWPWAQREGKPWQAAIEGLIVQALECKTFAVGL